MHGFSVIVFLAGILPPLVNAIFDARSYALGCAITATIYIALVIEEILNKRRYPTLLFIFISFLLIYGLFQNVVGYTYNEKSIYSLPVIVMYYGVAFLLADRFLRYSERSVYLSIRWLSISLISISFINMILDLRFLNYRHPVSIVPFGEPSHFALFSGPIFICLFMLSKSVLSKSLVLFVTMMISILLPTATLMIYSFLMMALLIRTNIKVLFFSLVGVVCFVLVILNNQYFYDRVLISSSSKNASALVYLQGIQDAYYSLLNTNFIGVGFQKMGSQPPSPIASVLMNFGGEFNREDGSFLASKIITEFGGLGVLIVLYILVRIVSAYFTLREQTTGLRIGIHKVVFLSYVYAFIVELMFRGVAYFSPGIFMFIVSLSCLHKLALLKQKEANQFNVERL